MSPPPNRAQLEAELLSWMGEPNPRNDDVRFSALTQELFAFQFAHCAPYRRFCEGRGVTPESCNDWRDIPAVPTGAFKELVLTSFPVNKTVHVFRTSGTSGDTRGALHLDTLALYEASLLPTFRRSLLPDLALDARARILVLAPTPTDAPDSSLSHMFGVAVERLGDSESGFFVQNETLDTEGLWTAFETASGGTQPLLICGTAFAFVHLIDAMTAEGRRCQLPSSTRIMETGGFKGRARERSRDELYSEIEAALGVPPARIVNQYGMSELGSQFYDSVLIDPLTERRKLAPPWTRIVFEDPLTGGPVPNGTPGVIRILDLANTGSVCAIQTADLGRSIGDGFEVIGREPGAEARGCSIAADELLGNGA